MTKRSYEMDMCRGPLAGKILMFSLPLILSGILQLLFNAADLVVVGKFAGDISDQALAAVGSTGSVTNLITGAFIGLSTGANVLVAQLYGASDHQKLSKAVHTAITLAFISGVVLVGVGLLVARPLLEWMETPADVIDLSELYMRIIFCGMPANMLYNFGSAILRSIGDTKRPLYFLLIAGSLNVVLNLVFVICFHMNVAGVALATVISQVLSAVLILICLFRMDGPCKLSWRHLGINGEATLKIARVGLPAGLQGCIFSISNVLIQSSINSFGSLAMAGSTSAANIEGFIYIAMNAVYQAALSFTSQNFGAKQYKRINKVFAVCAMLVTAVGLLLGLLAILLKRPLLSLYTDDPVVADFGVFRMNVIVTTYFFCGLMEVCTGVMRGIGYSILPMCVSLAGACGLRVLWIYTLFAADRTMTMLYLSYPVSWAITTLVHFLCFLVARRKLPKENVPLEDAA